MGTGIQEILMDDVPASQVPKALTTEPKDAMAASWVNRRWLPFIWTFLTTLSTFAIFLGQGVMVARLLGPAGRGEFGTAIYFPRDLFLYVGLLGSVELITSYAARGNGNLFRLRISAIRLGLVTGTLTAIVSALLAMGVLIPIQKAYLIPYALVFCLFLPFEHLQLTISSVDRGAGNYSRYNWNRLIFAAAFPAMIGIAYCLQLSDRTGISWLWLTCIIYVGSKIVGVLPTLWSVWPSREEWKAGKSAADSTASDSAAPPKTWRWLLEGRFYALSMLATELFERLDVLLILVLATVTDAGYYLGVAVPAATLLVVVPNALGVFTFNAGADHNRQFSVRQVVKWALLTVGFQLLATALLAAVLGHVIIFVFGNDYQPAILLALWLLPVGATKGCVQAADAFLKGRGKPLVGVWARATSIVVMLGIVAVTYSHLELLSIPMAACLGQIISFLIILAAIIADVKTSEPLSSPHPADRL